MSDTQELQDFEMLDDVYFPDDAIELVDHNYQVITWIGPHILRGDYHA